MGFCWCFCLQAYSDGTSDFPGPLVQEQEKKKGRNKRTPKGGEKLPSRYKKRKKDGDERQLMHSGTDSVMTQIKQVKLPGSPQRHLQLPEKVTLRLLGWNALLSALNYWQRKTDCTRTHTHFMNHEQGAVITHLSNAC